jgi:hypothetical protein
MNAYAEVESVFPSTHVIPKIIQRISLELVLETCSRRLVNLIYVR